MSDLFIGFTGHRNKIAKFIQLEYILKQYPDSTWIHGGAWGFDSQVKTFANEHKIPQIIIVPDYVKYGIKAPLIRNREIVDKCSILVAFYDGRTRGGTFSTIEYMKSLGREDEIVYLTVYDLKNNENTPY